MIKCIIIDFDGVIVESAQIKNKAFMEMFSKYNGINIDDLKRYLKENESYSRFVKFEYIYKSLLNREYDKDVADELGNEFSNIVYRKVIECPYVDGAKEFLQYFSKHYPLYVASNTPQEELEKIIKERNLQQYFKRAYGSPPGNKKEFIEDILEKEDIQPKETVYIGDMIGDYKVADETNINFIGRINVESFDEFNIPNFKDMFMIKDWLLNECKYN